MFSKPLDSPRPTRFRHQWAPWAASLAILCLASCGKGGDKAEDNSGSAASDGNEAIAEVEYDFVIPDVTYAWDPTVGDPEVPADQGGPGFTGEGWDTNMTYPALGSAEAVRGGEFRMYLTDWPATLRLQGKDYNTEFNYRARDVCQESLLRVHPYTLEFVPWLATHWKISEDKSTYTFRINPAARWSDGKEVVAQDVVATWKLLMDERILMPSNTTVYGKFEEPVAESKYIVSVKVKQESWRNIIYFAGMPLMPAHQISIPGDEFLTEFQNRYHATSGPYTLKDSDVVMNQTLRLTRRDDWWGEGNPGFQGIHNFDSYHFTVIKDFTLAYEKAKKGELDFYVVPKAQWWVEELVEDKVEALKRGLLVKKKFFNDAPVGTSGLALNTTRKPLDDVRIRKALALLRDRETMMDQLFFNEYEALNSYWQFGDYANPANPTTPYDPESAVALLEEAGYTELDSSGYRVKDGKRLSFEVAYRSSLSEPSLTIFQEDCKDAGIEIKLQLLTPATFWKNLRQREYTIAAMAWGALVFPNPETSWNGALATQVDNNNVTAFSDPRVDELLGEYDREYDPTKRSQIIQEIDRIVFEAHPYVLDWYGPSQRVIYQNKIKMPHWGVWRTSDDSEIMYCWWIDPEMEKALEEARKDSTKTLPKDKSEEHRFWQARREAGVK